MLEQRQVGALLNASLGREFGRGHLSLSLRSFPLSA